jgi:predicted nuclease of predicted toxin-antitoxin system
VRFVLDEDVDSGVARVFSAAGHEAWSITDAGLSGIKDDDVSIYAAQKDAVVVTHDVEFSARRRKNPHGRHVQMGCREREAASLVAERLDELIGALTPFDDVFIYLSKNGVSLHRTWS